MRNTFKRIRSVLSALACATLVVAIVKPAWGQSRETILTDNVVQLREVVSQEGFVHPGISCNAETLAVMREKVTGGVSPWVDYFEGMRRTRYADPNRRPARVEQILNDGGIYGLAHDAQLAWVQTILYIVTGNEEYRKLPVEIINWYGSRTEVDFFPEYFTDSHIKIGKYVYTLCSAADILRATTPKDERLAVTPTMIDALQKNCMHPIRKTCIERNDYFMNQHTYAIMGFLASTILGDEVEDYRKAVEWTTVNATTPNWGRSGDIKNQIRLVTRNDRTGEAVAPNLQLMEMGRDMPHAEGNINNLMMMSKTIDFQKTKVDPVAGTVTDKADGVASIHFMNDRLPKGAALYAKFNLGYGLPWVPSYSETDPNHPDYGGRYDYISPRGRGSYGNAFHYYYLKGIGIDMDKGPCRFVKVAFDATAAGHERARSGDYLDSIHNYGFDFWIGLNAAASDAVPSPKKAKRALSTVLPPLEVTYEGKPVEGQQFEYQFVDLSAHARPGDIYPGSPDDIPLQVRRDADGTGYVRMTIKKEPRTMVLSSRFPRGSGLRVRSDSFVKMSFYYDEKSAMRGGGTQELYVPDTKGEWNDVITDVDGNGLLYIQATSPVGSAVVDFDRIDTDAEKLRPLRFEVADDAKSVVSYVGAAIQHTYTATVPNKHLIGGAAWTPGKSGAALCLDGSRQYARLDDGIVSNLEDFSVSAWVKLDATARWARIFDFGDGRENYMFLTVSDGRAPKFAIRTPATPEQSVSGAAPLQTGVWQHVVVMLSGNTGILYVNGEETGRNSNITLRPSSLGKTRQNYIGKSQWPDPFLAGMVEDFTIFNKALSADEVKDIHAGRARIEATTPRVHYRFDPATLRSEGNKDEVRYGVVNLPAGAAFDQETGKFSWKPSGKQQGDHLFYIIARADVVVQTLPVPIHVARDEQAALDYVARAHDSTQKYVSATEQAFKAALKSRDMIALRRAVDGLKLFNPRLPDDTLDYRVAVCTRPQLININMMADDDPFTWGGIWGFDKNITMDFGNHFKVKSEAFRLLTRDGFPARMAETVVYGSNDRRHWTLLTENKTVKSPDFQTLTVKEEERNKSYRYLRLFMPAKPLPIFEVAEFRIIGERIEDYSPDYYVAYIKGYDDGAFRPDRNMTKAEAVCALANLVDFYTDRGVYTCDFVDVPTNAPYYDDVAYMSSKGIGNTWEQPVKYVTGDAENRFHPEAAITRGELAAIMSRMQWLKGDDGSELKDVTADTPHAAEIRRVAREGWLSGDEAGSFRPDAPVTRAEFVVAANRMIRRTEHTREGMPSFSDVDASHWAYDDIMKAATTYPVQSDI
ncbi:MAG: S-layer homology domain-containing protein [Pirellulales bacterium]|nr:S-layer homology domain-containing protein [Pirellulales bacterium]